jgi:alpha-D-xyloside xylohydrolase
MDWRSDEKTWNLGDEFMFGPSILVAPVLKEGAKHRSVYLPASPTWYDFWTGARVASGDVEADTPLDRIPLYVRAGSILPLGPEIEYADEKPDGPIELRVYAGADGDFNLYEDSGDGYKYQKGAHSVIPIHWDDAKQTLTIGAREGSYPGMPAGHTFHIVLVGPDRGVGEAVSSGSEKIVYYTGAAVSVQP